MKACKWIGIAVALLTFSSVNASREVEITISHHESISAFDWTRPGSANGQFKSTDVVTMRFDAFGRNFDLQLVSNDALISRAAQADIPGDIALYRGSIRGIVNSWARIAVIDGSPRGAIFDGKELFAIEAPGASAVNTKNTIIYRMADVYVPPGTVGCGTGPSNGDDMFKSLVGELSAIAGSSAVPLSEISVSTIGDFEFSNAMGGGSSAAILARMNIVDGIYSDQVGVQLNIQSPEVFTTANDPFSDTAVADLLLDDLANYRFDTPAHNSHGLTHLFTGRELNTTTVGIAFSNALCSRFAGAGLTQSDNGEMFDALVVAHEIGHNFGAPHDGQNGSVCVAEPQTFIMAPNISGSTQFSACSLQEMQDDIAGAACITPLPAIDMTVSLRGAPPMALLTNRVVFEYDVTNRGTLNAANVVVDFTLPANVTLESSVTTLGSCVDGSGTVSCTLGSFAGLGSAVITLFTNATSVGTDSIDASLTADVDDDPGNNQESVQVTVDPAVNLVISSPASGQVLVDQSRQVSVTIENQSTLEATNAVLTATFDAGLNVDAASWTIGSCTFAALQVNCVASNFAPQSTSTLTFTATGVAVGTQNYSVTLSSDQADAYTPDNNVSGSITVNSASGGGDDDGGSGAAGLALVLGCLMLVARRRRNVLAKEAR